ncbi:adenylyltransferase/cytidyltransferase family protein [Pseudomonas aeruginosa]
MSSKIKIAVYGGAFDPPHAGHASAIAQAATQAETLLIVPSFRHGFGKKMAPFDVRLAWLERMAQELQKGSSDCSIQVDPCERQLGYRSEAPIFTYDLLNHIAESRGFDSKDVGFVIGEDNVPVISQFYKAEQLISRFSLVVVEERLNIHSTRIREAIRAGEVVAKNLVAPGLIADDYSWYRIQDTDSNRSQLAAVAE